MQIGPGALQTEFVQFGEDMSYNHGPMLAPQTMEKFLVPQYQKVVSYLNARGVDVVGIDSDGLIDAMIPILYKAGVNLWAPLEIVAEKEKTIFWPSAGNTPGLE